MSEIITEFKIKENGKPQIKISKKINGTFGFRGNNEFSSKEGSFIISESNFNSKTKRLREFVIVIRHIGRGRNEGEYRLQQMHFNEEELIELRNSIDKILNYDSSNILKE